MGFKNFRLQCLMRVIVLGMTMALFSYLALQTTLYATLLLVGAAIVYQTLALIRYVEITNRQLTRFLQSIEYADLSQTFTGLRLGSSFEVLYTAFADVTNAFRKVRAEREEQYRYLQTVVQHVGVGVVAFQPNGDVELMNTAARRLLRTRTSIHNLAALTSDNSTLVETFINLKPGDKALVKIGELQLALHTTAFKMQDRQLKLVSIQNIQSELEEKEMAAWQDLIRVLTHEIMNSITPIASLASTANDLIAVDRHRREDTATDADEATDDEVMGDIQTALQTIQSRSEGLLHFVDTYRDLMRIPPPEFQIVPIIDLFERVERLLQSQVSEHGITMRVNVEPKSLEVTADPELIEQVLINLMANAIQALEGQPEPTIDLRAYLNEQGRVILQVTDNGPGILEDVQEKIFIPFFTTKQEGSGIGLSLSRQIMRLHRGTIRVRSAPHTETTFTLRF